MTPHFPSQGQHPLPPIRPPPPPAPGQGTHMRLLGGILRPSRNQVTCGLGKLAMRGAWMTAASPCETLWCFSPSSKLPMSAGGKSTHTGQGPEVSCWDCPAPGLGVVAVEGSCGAAGMTSQAQVVPRDPITRPITGTCPALCFGCREPFFSFLFRVTPVAYGGPQARG